MGAALSADMATLFDVGGIVGAVVAGVASDRSEMPASTCAVMLILSAPMVMYRANFFIQQIKFCVTKNVLKAFIHLLVCSLISSHRENS